MKHEKKRLILTTVICLLPIMAGLVLYSRLPERVPTHFDFSGTPDGWSSRPFAVFGLPCLLAALGYPSRIEIVVPLLTGILLLVIGNYLPKTKQSYTMGIKLPWTLQSEENWTRTHRLSGFLWVLCGLVMIPLSLLRLWSGWLFGVLLAVMVLIPAVYSYALHRKGI